MVQALAWLTSFLWAVYIQFVSLFNEVEHVQNFKPKSSIQVFFSLQTYVVIGHTADQTHFTEGQTGKAMQGSWAMDVIDTDRLQMASEAGYTQVTLTKLHPPECTPKNNLLIGRFWSFSMERSKDVFCWFLNGINQSRNNYFCTISYPHDCDKITQY